MKNRLFRIILLFAASLVLTLSASGQGSLNVQVHTSKAVPFTDTIGYTVDVYVSALDADGTPLKELTTGNFKLFEDSEQKTIKSVTAIENESMSLVLLMDTSGSMAGYVGSVQGYDGFVGDASLAASRFLERLGRNDRSAVMTFDDEIATLQQFTSDHYSSSEAAKQATSKIQGGTCLYDAIYAAMEMTLSEPEGRRAVVVFTDGKDETITGEKCSSKLVSDVMDFSLINRIPIYTLGFGPKTDDKDLKRMGESSGGSFIKAETQTDLDNAFNKLYEQLNNEYKLTYESDKAAGSHTLLVEASKEQAFGRDSCSITLPVMPTIMKFQSPSENAQLQGNVLLSVIFISQSAEVSNVIYSCNGQAIGSSVSKPYEFLWDVSHYPAQDNLFLEAVSFDKSGMELGRVSIPVSIIETPQEKKASIEFRSPHKGAEYQESVPIQAFVSPGNEEAGFVEYYGNGQYLGKVVSEPYEYSWDISKMSPGNIEIEAVVYSKDNRELAREKVMIYIHEMPTATPDTTNAETVINDSKYDNIMNQNKILLIVLGTVVVIMIILLIIIFKRKPVQTQQNGKRDNFGVSSPQYGLYAREDTIDGSLSGISANHRQNVFAVLTVKNSDDKSLVGTVINVTNLPLTLGRSAENDIVFSQNEKAVSKHHAILEDYHGQIAIRDTQSTYGTFINEQKIGTAPVVLENGAAIRLGPRTTLLFERMFTSIDGGNEDQTIDAPHGNGRDDDSTRQIQKLPGESTCKIDS